MVGYVYCPYCDEETMVTFEEHDSCEDIRDTCEHCDKDFFYNWEQSVDISSTKIEDAVHAKSEGGSE